MGVADQTRSLTSATLNVGANRKRSITKGKAKGLQSAPTSVVQSARTRAWNLPFSHLAEVRERPNLATETNAAHFLNMFIRMSSSKMPPLLQEEIKPRAFNHATNSRFTSLDSILGVAKPGRMSGTGSGRDRSISFAC